MKKSTELKQKIAELKNKIKGLMGEGKTQEAHAELSNLESLKQELEVAEVLEQEEIQNVAGFKDVTTLLEVDDKSKNRIFNKLILGKPLTESEREIANAAGMKEGEDEKGGYLVPVERETQIKELKRNYIELKPFCNVVSVSTNTGSMPIEVTETGKLIAFDELTNITESDISFAKVDWKIKSYGDITPLSRELLADENANLVGFIGKRFAKKAVRSENAKIIEILKTATAKTGTGHKDITSMLTKELDPAISAEAIIVTNQSGFDWLDKLEDKQGRPLLSDNLQNPTQKLFKGRRIVVLSDIELPSSAATKFDFYVGSLSEFIAFFDREGVEISRSDEAGFKQNAVYLRAIERFDVEKVDGSAMVKLTITPA